MRERLKIEAAGQDVVGDSISSFSFSVKGTSVLIK